MVAAVIAISVPPRQHPTALIFRPGMVVETVEIAAIDP
jgi:hypothetical protein